jgi:DNA-directed RNA polymerase specialized sigma24 family protein
LLGLLDRPVLKEIVITKMQGYTNRELADRFGVSIRTIERQLHLIRQTWRQDQT